MESTGDDGEGKFAGRTSLFFIASLVSLSSSGYLKIVTVL